MTRAASAALALALIPASLSACSSDSERTVTVSAAASLTDVFTDIGTAFESENPGVSVRFNFAGSSTLAEQINAGAPVDVFASASLEAMQRTANAGTTEQPSAFASNVLEIATPITNPAGIRELADLGDPSVTVVVCNVPVPCGAAALRLFEQNGFTVTPASLEPDVRAVLGKVMADEADAGIVYRTDIDAAQGDVVGIAIPSEHNVTTEYVIAATTSAGDEANRFIDFVRGNEGQTLLRDRGFGAP